MPSPLHEQLIDLLRTRPTLAAELLSRATGLPIDPACAVTARTSAQTFAQLRPPEYRADLVVELGAPRSELAIIVEVQLAPDPEKHASWPQYVSMLWSRLRCPVWLLVVAVDEAVAAGPTICRVATEAILSQRLAARYTCIDLIVSRLPEVARLAWEDWMSTNYEYQTELFRRAVDQGRAEGKAEAILAVLAARGLAVPESVAAMVRACRDPAELDRLLRYATLVASADELTG